MSATPIPARGPVRILIVYEDSRVGLALATRTMDTAVVTLVHRDDSPALLRASVPPDFVIVCPLMPETRASETVAVGNLPPVMRVSQTTAGDLRVEASPDEQQRMEAIRPSAAYDAAQDVLLKLGEVPHTNGRT